MKSKIIEITTEGLTTSKDTVQLSSICTMKKSVFKNCISNLKIVLMAGYIGFLYFDLGIWNLKRPFLRFMTCETPEGNSITWSNIKRNRKQSYLTVTYIIVRTLCVWFPNSNLYSGMFHRAWGIPSLYCHPSIQGDRKYYLQWTV